MEGEKASEKDLRQEHDLLYLKSTKDELKILKQVNKENKIKGR